MGQLSTLEFIKAVIHLSMTNLEFLLNMLFMLFGIIFITLSLYLYINRKHTRAFDMAVYGFEKNYISFFSFLMQSTSYSSYALGTRLKWLQIPRTEDIALRVAKVDTLSKLLFIIHSFLAIFGCFFMLASYFLYR